VNVPRETIAAALFAQLQTVNYPFVGTPTRAAKEWPKVDPSQQPIWYLIHPAETISQDRSGIFGLSVYTLHFTILVYSRTDPAADPINNPPDTAINQILDAFEAALKPGFSYQAQTLGQGGQGQPQGLLVANSWIEGDILIDSGILDDQVAILIPVHVKTGS
jgi:hypothetical protein